MVVQVDSSGRVDSGDVVAIEIVFKLVAREEL